MNLDRQHVREALKRAVDELMKARAPEGYWAGELSSSAFATAVAVSALAVASREKVFAGGSPSPAGAPSNTPANEPGAGSTTSWEGMTGKAVEAGLAWLGSHVNGDGGWGDTQRSSSSLGTTVLVWAALHLVEDLPDPYKPVLEAADRWLKQNAGRTEPRILIPAILHRLGPDDPTFSAPILLTCAMAGCLGAGQTGYRRVPKLAYAWKSISGRGSRRGRNCLASFAWPMQISTAVARQTCGGDVPPLRRLLDGLVRPHAIRQLAELQPAIGGFLGSIPVTAFVMIGMIAAGQSKHPMVRRGAQFLLRTVRPDGSWPVTPQMCTWITSLAVQALPTGVSPWDLDRTYDPDSLRWWLLRQQYGARHPITHTGPGGWAVTDQPGALPDSGSTAAVLLTLRALGEELGEGLEAIHAAALWLMHQQNRDGGIPLYARSRVPSASDASCPDLTSWCVRAWLAWLHAVPSETQPTLQLAASRAIKFLIQAQNSDGTWSSVLFANQFVNGDHNLTMGTAHVISVLPELAARSFLEVVEPLNNAVQWLIKAQNPDGGWGGGRGVAPSVEETASAVAALAEALVHPQILLPPVAEAARRACEDGVGWLVSRIDSGAWQTPAPIGRHLGRLWFFEKTYPLIFTAKALGKASEVFWK